MCVLRKSEREREREEIQGKASVGGFRTQPELRMNKGCYESKYSG